MSIVVNEPQFTELVHEMADARPGRADHLGECFLIDLRENWFRSAFIPKLANSSNSRASRFSVELKS
jgi:hypothetical protein